MSSLGKIAIFDLGSARAKLIVASRDESGALLVERHKAETGDSSQLTEEGAFTESAREGIRGAVRTLAGLAAAGGCGHSIAVATDVFRRATNGEVLLAELEGEIGRPVTLTAAQEGRIFYSALAGMLPGSDLCAADIGGGSVQVVWGTSEEETVSMTTGTFRLERELQTDRSVASSEVLAAIRELVVREANQKIPDQIKRPVLVFGSNCMADFIGSVCGALDIELQVDGRGSPQLGITNARTILARIAGRPYSSIEAYFPANPYFMRGADKALINVLAIADRVEADLLVPTNESVGTALARLALFDPVALVHLGILVTDRPVGL